MNCELCGKALTKGEQLRTIQNCTFYGMAKYMCNECTKHFIRDNQKCDGSHGEG